MPWLIAGQPVVVGEKDRPVAVGAGDLHLRVQCGERHAHVRWMRRDALVTCAEDRVDAVDAADRAAALAGHAFVARGVGVVEIIAARTLVEVAAVGGGVAQLCGRAGQDRRRQQRVASLHAFVIGGVGIGRERTEPQAAIVQVGYPRQR